MPRELTCPIRNSPTNYQGLPSRGSYESIEDPSPIGDRTLEKCA